MSAKISPKDFFLHLGATISLYASAIALLNLAFAIVNKALPDALDGYFAASSIVWPVSVLVVLVPVLYVVEWLIGRDIARAPEKKTVWIRRWRIYLTLFLAAALIGGDLIALINTYLNGEVTARFIWKVVVILVVAGSIGKYYFFNISDKWRWAKLSRTGNAWFGIVLALAAIVCGFLIVGSPAKQRAIRFDETRIGDLQGLQSEVISYWQGNGRLPASTTLSSIVSYGSLADPETGAAYGYAPIASSTVAFELCADFALPSSQEDPSATYNMPMIPAGALAGNYDWIHPAGQYCFVQTIDPDVYPLSK